MLQPRPSVLARARTRTHPAAAAFASLLAVSLIAAYPLSVQAAELAAEQAESAAPAVQDYVAPAAGSAAPAAMAGLAAVRDEVEITWRSPVAWPVAENAAIGNGFGYRGNVCAGCSTNHLGVDLFPGYGEPAFAIADGVVQSVSDHGGGFGVNVVVQHEVGGQQVTSVYAHLLPGGVAVVPGQEVEVGQLLAQTGNSGTSTAPHLHLEILVNGAHVDPLWWLRANILTEPPA